MLDNYFPEFMAFFFPDAHADIDWSRGYESLDTELPQIVRDAELGKRLADKLMKVWRRDGAEQIVLIHSEIQGDPEAVFAKRMYVYNYRLFDRYDRPVVSLAVLSDTSPNWRPNHYGYSLWGCRVGIEFPVVKLRDYEARWDWLEQNDNPFATIVMAHLRMQAARNDPDARFYWKTYLVRRLYDRGYQRKDILELFRFIDWIALLPEGLEARFRVEIEQFEAERNMPYITSIERHGIEQGVQQGVQQGIQQGEVKLLKRLLKLRFGQLPEWVEKRLLQASEEELQTWADKMLKAQQLDDVFDAK